MSTPTAPATGSAESRQICRQTLDQLNAKVAELQTLADNQAEDIERLLADKARRKEGP